MKTYLILRIILFSNIFISSISVLAAEYDPLMPAEPAQLDDSSRSLQNRLQFPNIQEDVFVLVLCNTSVTRKGEFGSWLYCYRDEDMENSVKPRTDSVRHVEVGPDVDVTVVVGQAFDWYEERFEREVVEAARISRIQPARLNGKRVSVKMNFSVLFRKRNGEESIEVFLHHFRNEAMLGRDYIAAQRFDEQKRLFDSKNPDECPVAFTPVWIKSIVMANGSAYNVGVDDETFLKAEQETVERCLNAYQGLVKRNLHVPTISGGRYVNGFAVELFYNDLRDDNAVVSTEVHDSKVQAFKNRGARIAGEGRISISSSKMKEIFGDMYNGAESVFDPESEEDRYDEMERELME